MMGFKQAVDATPHLRGLWKPGLQALRAEDKPHVRPETPKYLRGSVDIDTAHQKLPDHASANRWDFAIGFQHTNRADEVIYWVETHSGSDGQIETMLRKFAWLKKWLRSGGRQLAGFKASFVWAPSGATSFTQGSQQVRKLAAQGLTYVGSRGVVIPDAHEEPTG